MEAFKMVLVSMLAGGGIGIGYFLIFKPNNGYSFAGIVIGSFIVGFGIVVVDLLFGKTEEYVLHHLAEFMMTMTFFHYSILLLMRFGKSWFLKIKSG